MSRPIVIAPDFDAYPERAELGLVRNVT